MNNFIAIEIDDKTEYEKIQDSFFDQPINNINLKFAEQWYKELKYRDTAENKINYEREKCKILLNEIIHQMKFKLER